MRVVSELYGRHEGSDIYIVGTGTSLRVFPLGFFRGKITIGLNQAWKVVDTLYGITMMPKLNIPEFIDGEKPKPEITWITKPSKVLSQCSQSENEYANLNFFGFENDGKASGSPLDKISQSGRCLDWVRVPHPRKLYLWTSISQSAMNLAANMGARSIILVGCDNAALGQNHHSHDQHTMWRGDDPSVRYMQYYDGVAEVRSVLREKGINVVSLTPFVKLDGAELDFSRLCKELEQKEVVINSDIPRLASLMDENAQYVRLTAHVVRRNVSHLLSRARWLKGWRKSKSSHLRVPGTDA